MNLQFQRLITLSHVRQFENLPWGTQAAVIMFESTCEYLKYVSKLMDLFHYKEGYAV